MKVEYIFDPFEMAGINPSDMPSDLRASVMDDVRAYVLENVLLDVSRQLSPVTGRQWKGLSPEYKKKKLAEIGVGEANLVLSGDMLDSLTVNKSGKSALVLTVGDSQQDKADGHNNHSGKSKLPARKFIPETDSETFRKSIRDGIKEIVLDAFDQAAQLGA